MGAPVSGSGVDGAGAYSTIALSWARTTAGASTPRAAAEWVTTFKAYGGNANRSALVFQQHWPAGVQSAAGGSAFPSLKQAEGGQELGTLECAFCGACPHRNAVPVSTHALGTRRLRHSTHSGACNWPRAAWDCSNLKSQPVTAVYCTQQMWASSSVLQSGGRATVCFRGSTRPVSIPGSRGQRTRRAHLQVHGLELWLHGGGAR